MIKLWDIIRGLRKTASTLAGVDAVASGKPKRILRYIANRFIAKHITSRFFLRGGKD